jgi:lipopolysaccharide O-acetyltransferase
MVLGSFGRRSSLAWPVRLGGGKGIQIGNSVTIHHHAQLSTFLGANCFSGLSIGDNTVIHPYAHIAAAKRVTIGEGVLIAPFVYISDHDHDASDPYDPPIFNNRLLVSPVEIGSYVWIGERVCILKGVTIGERSVIGAGSVVVRSIPPLSIAVGAPARVIRSFDTERREWVVP